MSSYTWPPSGGGVTTIDGMTGNITLVAGANITIVDDTVLKTITISAASAPVSFTPVGSSPNANGATAASDVITLQPANTSFPGVLLAADWNTFNNKQASLTFSAPLVNTANTISITQSGVATNGYLSSTDWNTFNNKQSTLTLGNLTDVGTDGIVVTGGTGSVVGSGTSIAQHVADSTHNGYLSSTDWSTFNNKQSTLTLGNLTDVGTDGITITGGTGAIVGSGTSIAQQVADTTHNGYLSSTDWNTFNGKQSAFSGLNTNGAIYATSATAVASTAAGTVSFPLVANSGSAPTFRQLPLTAGVTGTLPTSNGGTGTNQTFTSGSVTFIDGSGNFTQDNSKFKWDDTLFQLSLGGHLNTAALGISQTGGSNVGFDLTTTASNTAMQVQNQGAQIAGNFVTAANSATQGGTLVLGASRGTNSARTASQAADQIGLFAAQSYNGSSFGPGYCGGIGFIATEAQTSSHNGGQLSIATTPNGTLSPVVGLTIGQNQLLQLPAYTTAGVLVNDTSGNITATATLSNIKGGTGTNSSASTGIAHVASGTWTYSAVNLANSDVTGVVPIANGGTNNASLAVTAGGVIYSDGTRLQNVGAGTSGFLLKSNGASAPTWVASSFTPVAPTVQRFTSGSGTYTLPTSPSPLYIKVTMVGGGGGGSGSGAAGGSATPGNDTTFGSSFLTAGGGAGAVFGGYGGVGGIATASISTGIVLNGSAGQGGSVAVGSGSAGGVGGTSPLGGAALPGALGANPASDAQANSGSGGAGGGSQGTGAGGSGGGSGAYIQVIITSPSSTYAYAVGAGGPGGTTSSLGSTGSSGGSGYLLVEEFYQ